MRRISCVPVSCVPVLRSALGLALVAHAALLSGCIPHVDTGEDGGTGPITVGPNGGIFVRSGFTIDIPAGAVESETIISFSIVDTNIPEVPMRKRISYGYRFAPSGLKFKSPPTLYLPWIADRLPKAVDKTSYDMRRQSGTDAFLELPNAKTGQLGELEFVEAKTDRLGLFWLTAPTTPNIARLELTPVEANLQKGATQQFDARVVSPTGEEVDIAVTWSVVPPRVGTVDANGLFTAKEPGVATITATAGTQSETATVRVFGMPTGPATFVHENPFPTGNDLWGGYLGPAALGDVFVGANGTVLSRNQQGTWARHFSSPGVILRGVGGSSLTNAAAIGSIGTDGVLVEIKGTTPTLRIFKSVEPRHMWFDGSTGMAVGVGNDVLLNPGGTTPGWKTEGSPSFEALLDVIGDGAGHFVTVGARGSIYRWDPVRKVWDSLYQTQLATLLTAAVITDDQGHEAWAVGGSKLWHFAGAGWVAQALPDMQNVVEASSMGAFDNKLVIGLRRSIGPGVILTYEIPTAPPPPVDAGVVDAGTIDAGVVDAGTDDAGTSTDDAGLDDAGADFDAGEPLDAGDADAGDTDAGTGVDAGTPDAGAPPFDPWRQFVMRSPQAPRGVISQGRFQPRGFVVGDYGAVYEWNAGTQSFDERSSGFYGDVADIAVIDDHVYASVNECLDPPMCTTKEGAVYHRGPAGTWEMLGTPFPGPVFAIAAKSTADVTVSLTAAFANWSGASWTSYAVTGSQAGPINDLKWCGATLWGAGAGGAVYTGVGTQLANARTLSTDDAYAVWCPTEQELWFAGTGYLVSRIGNAWVGRSSNMVNHAPWRAVWSPGGGEAFALGDARFGVWWDTQSLHAVESIPVPIDIANAMWGSTIDNLYAVGITAATELTPVPFGFAMRFDGVQWSLIDSGSFRAVTAIDGSDAKNVWVGTAGGGLLRAVNP